MWTPIIVIIVILLAIVANIKDSLSPKPKIRKSKKKKEDYRGHHYVPNEIDRKLGKLFESRYFTNQEIDAVRSLSIVNTPKGKAICFFMKKGGQNYIPLLPSIEDKHSLGEAPDIRKLSIIKFHKEGDGITLRIDIDD